MVTQTAPMLATVDQEHIEAFQSSLRGTVIQPDDEHYDAARHVYNAMVDKRPGLIARCANVADVISAVNFARENDLTLAVRGGGHSLDSLGSCDDGLVIDLSSLNDIQVDPAARTARVGGGCTWGEVDRATHPHGLATVSGAISTIGVGGLTLGGGHGHLTRKHGLTIDNLLEAEMVLADGRLVTANEVQHPDLFWAIRGGGGNFGIVTTFKFQLHPVETITGGPTLWPFDQAREVMQWYREFIVTAPEELNGIFFLMTVPPAPPFPEALHLKKVCAIVWCYAGPAEKAEDVFKAIREFGPPALYGIQEMPYPALQSAFDGLYPPGLHWYLRAEFINELSDKAIEHHLEYGSQLPTPQSSMNLYPISGAAQRVGRNDTAFSYREANWSMAILGVDSDPGGAERIKQWTVDYWKALHPTSAGGPYVNFMMEEGQERVKATYRDNYEQLAKIKTKYDPTNLFRRNQNIRPAAGG